MLSTWSRLDYRRKGRPGWQKISTGLACWANCDIISSIGERSGSVEGLKRCRPGTAACRSHRRDDRSRFGLSVSWFATPSPTKPAACSATTSCRAVLRSTSTRSAAVQPHARQLIWRLICQGSARKWRQVSDLARLSCGAGRCQLGVRVRATRGQTDMRGLVTAGRAVRQELRRVSNVERGRAGAGLLIARSRVAPRAAFTGLRRRSSQWAVTPGRPGTSTSRPARGRSRRWRRRVSSCGG